MKNAMKTEQRKVSLAKLEVQSFVTNMAHDKQDTAKGGAIPESFWYTACWRCYY